MESGIHSVYFTEEPAVGYETRNPQLELPAYQYFSL